MKSSYFNFYTSSFDLNPNPIEFYDSLKCSNLCCDNNSSTALRSWANFYICSLNFLIGKKGLRLYLFFCLFDYLVMAYYFGCYTFVSVLSLYFYVAYSFIFWCCSFLGIITVVLDWKNADGSLLDVFLAILGCLKCPCWSPSDIKITYYKFK